MIRGHLVLFVRPPRIGRVKTRLAADIGPIAAWQFYRQTVVVLLRRLRRHRRWRCWLAFDGREEVARMTLPVRDWTVICQGAGDLGERMARTLKGLPPGPAVVVGSDLPDLSCTHVAWAFDLLQRFDLVFGPAVDGGYWLVAVRQPSRHPNLFADVRWSSRHALSDTLANAVDARTMFLDVLEDVDDGPSYARWRRRRSESAVGCRPDRN